MAGKGIFFVGSPSNRTNTESSSPTRSPDIGRAAGRRPAWRSFRTAGRCSRTASLAPPGAGLPARARHPDSLWPSPAPSAQARSGRSVAPAKPSTPAPPRCARPHPESLARSRGARPPAPARPSVPAICCSSPDAIVPVPVAGMRTTRPQEHDRRHGQQRQESARPHSSVSVAHHPHPFPLCHTRTITGCLPASAPIAGFPAFSASLLFDCILRATPGWHPVAAAVNTFSLQLNSGGSILALASVRVERLSGREPTFLLAAKRRMAAWVGCATRHVRK